MLSLLGNLGLSNGISQVQGQPVGLWPFLEKEKRKNEEEEERRWN